jgi:hypothetical protein
MPVFRFEVHIVFAMIYPRLPVCSKFRLFVLIDEQQKACPVYGYAIPVPRGVASCAAEKSGKG